MAVSADEEPAVQAALELIEVGPEDLHEIWMCRDLPDVLTRAVLKGTVLIDGAAVRPGSAGRLSGAPQGQLTPTSPGKVDVITSEVSRLGRAQARVVEAGEEGLEGGYSCRTAVRRSLACDGLMTTRRSTSSSWLVRRAFMRSMGFEGSRCSSTAYSRALNNADRFRAVVVGAADVPSSLSAHASTACLMRTGSSRGSLSGTERP